jgi:hypothetical protein
VEKIIRSASNLHRTDTAQAPLPKSNEVETQKEEQVAAATGLENLAVVLSLCDCILVDVTDTILLYETLVDPSVLVKLQQNPSMTHVIDEMENEAKMYEAIKGKADLVEFLPRFRGYSTHMGVAMTCIERESDDFDDIGRDNLSEELKQSAVLGVQALSQAGILHNDLELRNIVRSKDDPNRAKIIDLGRPKFSDDEERLSEQVEDVKALLGILGEKTSSSLD